MVDRTKAIEALKSEVEILNAEKTRLTKENSDLRTTQATVDELRAEVTGLKKDLNSAKTAEAVSVERVLKTEQISDTLRKEVEAERTSGAALKAQVDLLSMRLEDARVDGVEVAELY